ncbi:uncharacterized protein MONBRDRAFT_33466 [Monosiga brevicollis MX1]|uniref:NADH-cytochrome b5 reductase n=1 Tax=Monosiga brevicollis TaxID=81824 RepID=A9V5J1_MONBE|nr:uncharacterized protein MONBRDRAFT_33466 [Monosiga brevicollis MX1]EDQ87379.1 predicted protein [Monosiga brevicollis MX1]|eukprot:XP_001747992.1 hypothetical protein [Monosiga brevicollis MX1]
MAATTLWERLCSMDIKLLGVTGIVAAGAGVLVGLPFGAGALLVGLGAAYYFGHRSPPIALNPDQKIPFALIEKEVLSHDTTRFRFALQSPEHVLGLPVGKHMNFSCKVDGKLVVRSYTPVSSNDEIGYFDMVIKVYKPLPPRFPDGGKMSQYFDQMKIGDTIDVRGPAGHIEYARPGVIILHKDKKSAPIVKNVTKFAMIAGGTGITPCLQIIRAIKKNPADRTEVYLVFANKSEDDILLRKELDEVAEDPRFHIWYTIDKAGPGWKYSEGYIDEAMLREHLPPVGEDVQALMCGPPPMLKFACVPNLEKLGYRSDQMATF